ncbi:hypothetical protein HY411_01880 [Candidatus Gottesmanbacteria bacterium]|nr:hypothetical protein [Candidatus Gottesmanbacteria bacterium]
MTQVSRMPLPKALETQMHAAIRKAFADLRSEEQVGAFLDDLLTPTEKVMLAKRLAIAILLDRGYDQRTVHTIMKTSLRTVNMVNYWLKNRGRGYRLVLEKLKTQQAWRELKEGFEDFLEEFFSTRRKFSVRIPKDTLPRDHLV